MAKSKLPVGAHLEGDKLLQQARSLVAVCIQIFLSSPQSWKAPPPHPEAKGLKASKRGVYVHAPYLINVCSPRPNVRYGSRKILQQTCEAAATVGAKALIVHPGHSEDGVKAGVARWARTLEMLESPVPVYLENTAGGDNAVARRFDALAKLWDAVAGVQTEVEIGFCFDTCHAHAAGEELDDAVERARKITGRLDLLHVNDSRDPPGTGADRHANIGKGQMDPGQLRHMIKAAKAPAVVETPRKPADIKADIAFVREALTGR
jgi:deoxyribonuclease IV